MIRSTVSDIVAERFVLRAVVRGVAGEPLDVTTYQANGVSVVVLGTLGT